MKRILSANSGRRRVAAIFSLVLLFTAGVSSTSMAAAGGVDAVLVMDSSGSMAKNDPRKLRVPAARMFMSLLGGEDRIGLISFSDNGYPVLHLTTPATDTNARILASADKVSSKGVYTNLYAALSKGIEMLEREGKDGQEKMLVLMSDGRMDVGNSDEDWTLTQKLQGELLQAARDKGIKLYTIAFTESSDGIHHMRCAALRRAGPGSHDRGKVSAQEAQGGREVHEVPPQGGGQGRQGRR